MFSYLTATQEELVRHIVNNTRQTIHAAKKRYSLSGREDVIEKIEQASILAKIEKLKQRVTNDNSKDSE